MANYFTDIKAGIISFLQTSTKVRNIYDFENVSPAGYPCINVTPAGGDGTFLDTQRVRRNFLFTVQVLQERLEVGPSEAERIITALVEDLIALFENANTTTLANTVKFVEPPTTQWGYLQVPDADVRSCEITLVGVAAQ